MYGRPEWVGVMVVVGCVAGRAGGRVKGGVAVGCVGMGGVCGGEAGGGGREGEGGVGDAGFVLPVAYVTNLTCCCLS